MKVSTPTIIVPLLFLLFSKFTQIITLPTCPEIEKHALLTFKHSLNDSLWNFLSSWNGKTDCCEWSGVFCNNLTGHVHQLDLLYYELSGKLDPSLLNLKHLRYLDLSWNNFQGPIPNTVGDMKQLESLDLSRNFLSGGLPESFKTMSSLSYLNMSHNNLTGRIPECTQIGVLDPSSFAGNTLCGPPLSNSCSNVPKRVPKVTTMVRVVEKRNIQWLYVFISLGFAMGLSSFCSALVLNKSWRETYFEFLDDLWDGIYVRFNIAWRKVIAKCRGQVPRG